jgi:hypothetical protein
MSHNGPSATSFDVCRLVAIGGEADIERTLPKDLAPDPYHRSCGHRSVVIALAFTLVGAKRINPAHALIGQLLLGALVLSQMVEAHAA